MTKKEFDECMLAVTTKKNLMLFKQRVKEQDRLIDYKHHDPHRIFTMSFRWSGTPEGPDYWEKIYDKLERYSLKRLDIKTVSELMRQAKKRHACSCGIAYAEGHKAMPLKDFVKLMKKEAFTYYNWCRNRALLR